MFKESKSIYGARKIKATLDKEGFCISRRRIGRIMKKFNLISKYTKVNFKNHATHCNEEPIKNVLNRQFNPPTPQRVIVSDLTYVKVKSRWHYIGILIDLFNREIVGYSAGTNKNASLIMEAFSKVSFPLTNVELFHTDRGLEFDNSTIDMLLQAFQVKRSLSKKGCPYDNAIAETTFKAIKVEFVKGRIFNNLKELKLELADYVNWFNTKRIHGSLNYLTPIEFKTHTLKILSE